MTRYFRRLAGLAVLLALPLASAAAQQFPSKPLRLIAPFAAGGSTDTLARAIAEKMAASLGQPVVVENRPGAASLTALDHVRTQPADGYTIVLSTTTITTLPSLNANAKYSVAKDFTALGGVAKGAFTLVVHSAAGVSDLAGLIALAKAQPDKLTWALASQLGFDHLGAEKFMRDAGIKIQTVGYKGDADMMADLVSGRVQVAMGSLRQFAPHFATGVLKPLAVSSTARLADLPNTPTFVEAGTKGYVVEPWFAMFAPAGVPANVVAVLNREITAAAQSPEVGARIAAMGWTPMTLPAADMAALAASSETEWARVIGAMGLKPQ
jgi:tripartite-type tricarboxylate transporter receptor subunit TctC